MRNNALSIANYFIDLAKRDSKELQPLKLMKLVYIAYGFGLAALDKSIIDYRFDKVEAWRLGPVIPSVYHSFKMYGDGNVKKTVMFGDDFVLVEPSLEDKYAKKVCDVVWFQYGNMTGSELVTLLHSKGTPWWAVYEDGRNNPIPEDLTKRYYTYVYQSMQQKVNE